MPLVRSAPRTWALALALALAAACLVAGCDDEPTRRPDFGGGSWDPPYPDPPWDPGPATGGGCTYGYGEDCPDAPLDCSDGPCLRGRCEEGGAEGGDVCVCDAGYAGLRCDACAEGYEALGLDCVPLGSGCDDSPCVYGTCRIRDGEAVCDCAAGYAGRLCDRCAAGYRPEALRCVPE